MECMQLLTGNFPRDGWSRWTETDLSVELAIRCDAIRSVFRGG
jgi:hypothetical protein